MTPDLLIKTRQNLVKQHVTIYLKDMNISATTPDGENVQISAMVEGYVIDVDDVYVYVGDKRNKFNKLITHEVVGVIEINDNEPKQAMILPGIIDTSGECH